MGFIYLILQVDSTGDETHKIGITKNDPKLRVKQLSTGNPNQVSLLQFYESDRYNKIENLLHKKFSPYKTIAENEWFNLPQEVIMNFKEECKKTNDMLKFLEENNTYINKKSY